MSILRGFGAFVLAISLSATLSGQTTQTKETVPGGPKVTTNEVKGELVATGSNWLIAKDGGGHYRVYNVKAGRTFTIDGVPKTLSDLEPGTKLTAQVTTTETPQVTRTTTITQGTVFWAAPKSIIVTLGNGENKQYEVPDGFKFTVDGKQLEAMELRKGMKLTGTRVVEEKYTTMIENITVTGTYGKGTGGGGDPCYKPKCKCSDGTCEAKCCPAK